ncbi:transmembrane protease serine 6-like [Scleropages formosus]|uniref:transmembrane protease serine 6-like n=1 Tax=Scleropages formosus TaxID=113540 RepID=UPI0010FA79EC|nr:transmembrane protease serine 6-like [Scleropages formosus]
MGDGCFLKPKAPPGISSTNLSRTGRSSRTMALLKCLCSLVLLAALAEACGQAPLNTGKVSGPVAAPGSWPWVVSMSDTGYFACQGSLINNQWVLTSAYCFVFGSSNPGDWLFYLGRQNQSGNNPNEVSRTLSRIILHPDFRTNSYENIIALVQLSSPVNFNDYIQPVCLAPNGSTFYNSTDMWVTGWGAIDVPCTGTTSRLCCFTLALFTCTQPSVHTVHELALQRRSKRRLEK